MANRFVYNSVDINNPNVTIFKSSAIYDAAGTGVIYTKTLLRVVGVVQFDEAFTMAQNAVFFRQKLLTPRGSLQVNLGSPSSGMLPQGDMFNLPSGDDVGGPKPLTCEFTDIIGSNFSILTFEIEVGVAEACTSPSNIISHTFSATHSLDARFFTTRTIRGSIRVRQSATVNNPDTLRNLVVPTLPNGFRRAAMDFLVSLDGLQLDYTITDRELFAVAPSSAVEWSGTFVEQATNYIWYHHFSIELKGHAFSDQFNMLKDCFAIAAMRIKFDQEFITQASVTEVLHDNVVRLDCTTRVNASAAANAGQTSNNLLPAGTRIFTGIDNYTDVNTALGPYGTAILMAAKTPFYNSCGGGNPVIRYVGTAASQNPAPTTSGAGVPESSELGGANPSILDPVQSRNPYVDFYSEINYEQENGAAILPSTYLQGSGRVYQLHNPYMVIRQSGYAVRMGQAVDIPTPQSTYNGTLRVKRVKQFSPLPMPDRKTFQYSAAWYYEILIPFTTADFRTDAKSGFVDTNVGNPGGKPYLLPDNPAVALTPTSGPQPQLAASIIVLPVPGMA